jgi:exopolysaccharide biosynthesis polyprenyl glycosylphosphotransferase
VPQILGYLTRHAADIVVLALSLDELIAAKELIDSILELGLAVGVMPESFDVQLIAHRTDVKTSHGFAGARMIVMRNVFQPAPYLFAKRVLDLVLSSIALLVLSPLFLLIAIMVKVSSEGPVFYPWQVLGRNRKPFTGYKFRTMVCNADEIKKDLMKFNEMTGPVFKMRKDPRVTPIGRWLRKFSLDEIPQFYSVLKGDMSLVGPRPPSKSESDRFEFWQHRKLSVKPGITCLWQVNGRTEIADFAEWAELDLRYIKTASFILDLRILLKTVPVVLFGRGAC